MPDPRQDDVEPERDWMGNVPPPIGTRVRITRGTYQGYVGIFDGIEPTCGSNLVDVGDDWPIQADTIEPYDGPAPRLPEL